VQLSCLLLDIRVDIPNSIEGGRLHTSVFFLFSPHPHLTSLRSNKEVIWEKLVYSNNVAPSHWSIASGSMNWSSPDVFIVSINATSCFCSSLSTLPPDSEYIYSDSLYQYMAVTSRSKYLIYSTPHSEHIQSVAFRPQDNHTFIITLYLKFVRVIFT
jgi:hypothetical protein